MSGSSYKFVSAMWRRCSASPSLSVVQSNNTTRILSLSSTSLPSYAKFSSNALLPPTLTSKIRSCTKRWVVARRPNQQPHRVELCVSTCTSRHSSSQTNCFSTTSHRLSSSLSSVKNHYDVIIVGGGAVGSTLARLLSDKVPSLDIALLDSRTPKPGDETLAKTKKTPNARAYAMSPKNLGLLGEDVLDRLQNSGRIAFYDSMQVSPIILYVLYIIYRIETQIQSSQM